MKVVPKRNFLLRQEEQDGGKKKDIVTQKGVAIEVTEKEFKRFRNDFAEIAKKK